MKISRITIKNFRNFRFLDIPIKRNTISVVGENNTGKTNLIAALRLALDSNLSSYHRQLQFTDFPAGIDFTTPNHVLIVVEFQDFEDDVNAQALLHGCIEGEKALITFRFRPRPEIWDGIQAEEHDGTGLTLDDYVWQIRGGGQFDPQTLEWHENIGISIRFEELQQGFMVMNMDALRDVEQRLKQFRNSPLTRLLTSADIPEEEQTNLVTLLHEANEKISASETINKVGEDISKSFELSAGSAYSMKVSLGMSPPTFSDISRGLTLLLSNNSLRDFDPSRNGLGLNNILFMSMLLEYFSRRVEEGKTAGQLLIVEEPEAHLHPQLQRVFYGMLGQQDFQCLLSTHSTHITSQAPLDSLIVLTNDGTAATASMSTSENPLLEPRNIGDLERYLDATRASLFFARKVLLVEGPAEQFLIPVLAQHVLGVNLDEHGITVIPIFGVHFESYARLFGESGIVKKCAIVADGDLSPSDSDPELGEDEDVPPYVKPELIALENDHVKTFVCESTFEIELTDIGSLKMLTLAAREIGAPRVADRLEIIRNEYELIEEDDQLITEAARKVLNTAKRFGKARFAQVASKYSNTATYIPKYIADSIAWLMQD